MCGRNPTLISCKKVQLINLKLIARRKLHVFNNLYMMSYTSTYMLQIVGWLFLMKAYLFWSFWLDLSPRVHVKCTIRLPPAKLHDRTTWMHAEITLREIRMTRRHGTQQYSTHEIRMAWLRGLVNPSSSLYHHTVHNKFECEVDQSKSPTPISYHQGNQEPWLTISPFHVS